MLISFAWPLEGSPNSPLLQKPRLIELLTTLKRKTCLQLPGYKNTKQKQESSSVHMKICMWTKCTALPLLWQQKMSLHFLDVESSYYVREMNFAGRRISFYTQDYQPQKRWWVWDGQQPHQPVLPIPHPSALKSLHQSIHFSTKCAFRPLSADFQSISPPWDPSPRLIWYFSWWKQWWILHLILLALTLVPWKEITKGFHSPAKSTLSWEPADYCQLSISNKVLLFFPSLFFFLF